MRRFRNSEESDDSDSGEESLSFKRNRRSGKSLRIDDEVDNRKTNRCQVNAGSNVPESRNGVRVIQYASATSSVSKVPSTNGDRAYHNRRRDSETVVVTAGSGLRLQCQASAVETIRQLGFCSKENNIDQCDEAENNNKQSVVNEGGTALENSSTVITDRSSATEIMRKMGFDKSKGLGQLMCDREVSVSKLEALQSILEKAGIIVDDASLDLEEEIHVEEEIKWIQPVLLDVPLDFSVLYSWRKVGPKKKTIRGETNFIKPNVLEKLLVLKNCLNVFNDHEYFQLRSRCNPFEKIGKGPFVSRAGLKMASIDAALSYALTQPTTNSADKLSFVGPNELFYFADICAGPGGFSEYVLFRKRWGAKGFGMTLKGKLDFDVLSFFSGSPESFEPYYGPANDGNVYNPRNVAAFIEYVYKCTDGRGVHLMMADGGFDVDNKEMQEPLSARIYISQCLLALSLVRPGGMFVCKLFDTLTPFTVGLIYLMYHSFELVAIHKPNTSRPANSERYLICKWKKSETEDVMKYFGACHALYWDWECRGEIETKEDIVELVPLKQLKESEEFYKYILESNNCIARSQIEHLKRMVIFSRNPHLEDPRQEIVRKRSFEYWKIPEKSNKNVISTVPNPVERAVKKLMGGQPEEFLRSQEFMLTENNLEAFIRSPFDWRIVVVEALPTENNRGYYISLGSGRIYRFNGSSWTHIVEKLELSKDTLVFGEFVDEIHGKKPNQRIIKTFHLIDAMVLGSIDVRGLHYTSRHEVCVKFAKSMNKPSRHDLCPVRAKVPVRMENIADVFGRLENRVVTGSGHHAQLVCPVDHTDETLPFIKPIGILFLKITKDPWTMALSKTSNRKYYFNVKTGLSSYEIIPESVSEFSYTMQNRIVWWWDKELKTVLATQDVTEEDRKITLSQNSLNPHTLLRYVGGGWNKNTVMRRLSTSSNSQSSC